MIFDVKKGIHFIKKEAVLVIATILAMSSCILVPPSKVYASYIDFRVLSLLFSLMLIVAGFRSVFLFDILAEKLLHHTHTIRRAALLFILLCFFSSMLITNDVALILFVPFSIFTLKKYLTPKTFIFLIIFETLGANLGSMFTPIGNPQNLYIFSIYRMHSTTFFYIMFPYTAVSFLLLMICSLLFPDTAINEKKISSVRKNLSSYAFAYICYSILFFIALTTVARITPYQITLAICVFIVFFLNKKLFMQVDYFLLLTFVAFFVFVGNLGQLSTVQEALGKVFQGHEQSVSILLSQVISNVPATLFLSHFTQNSTSLLIGVNLGGLGTMIASMASLISFKFYMNEKESRKLSYFLWFTLFNLIFLSVLLIVSLC